ncbi:MAG: ABC transporter ATP-binding protein [Capsulimonadaceae bacterium]
MSDRPVLALHEVTKRYGTNLALDQVDFSASAGEIHAVLGENGAGKSTLMHVMRGLTRPDSGRMEIRGAAVDLGRPGAARERGIGMVHQHFMLVPSFTVAENLALAESADKANTRLPLWPRIGVGRMRANVVQRAAEIARRLGWEVPLTSRTADLPVGTQQRVEIVRALLADADILLFDEPTSVLAPTETVELFRILRTLRDEGRSIVFVSHKLAEVMALCDRVTVLRNGRVSGVVPVSATSVEDLASRMVGTDESAQIPIATLSPTASGRVPGKWAAATSEPGRVPAPVLRVDALSTAVGAGHIALRDIGFSVAAGETLGFAGVDGNGQRELAEVLSGLCRRMSGSVTLDGRPVARIRATDLAALGIALIPPDRNREGLALDLSVEENLLMQAAMLPEFRRGPFLRRAALSAYARRLAGEFDIRAASLRQPVRSLSGGNQQKIVAARALARRPRLIIAVSPTRGLDIAATAYIHRRLRESRDQGAAVLLISTELDEVIEQSDRIAVLFGGRIVDIVAPDTPRPTLGLLMGGARGADAADGTGAP